MPDFRATARGRDVYVDDNHVCVADDDMNAEIIAAALLLADSTRLGQLVARNRRLKREIPNG